VSGLLDLCLGPVKILLILRLDMCDPAASGFERLSPICVPGEALASAMAVGRVIADCVSWLAEIRADILDSCCPVSCCCSADFARPSTTCFRSSADSFLHWSGL